MALCSSRAHPPKISSALHSQSRTQGGLAAAACGPGHQQDGVRHSSMLPQQSPRRSWRRPLGLAMTAVPWLCRPRPRTSGQRPATAEPSARCRAAAAAGLGSARPLPPGLFCRVGTARPAPPWPQLPRLCSRDKAPPGPLWGLLLECARNLVGLRAKRNDHHCVWNWGEVVGRAVFVLLLMLEIAPVLHLP